MSAGMPAEIRDCPKVTEFIGKALKHKDPDLFEECKNKSRSRKTPD